MYSSVAVSAGSGSSSGGASVDLLSGRLTAQQFLIPPTASLAWFSSAANYIFNINSSSISGNANAGAFSTAINTIFLQVFEYADVNGNGVYDPNSTDVIVSSINLNNLLWDTLCTYNDRKNPLTIYNLTSAGLSGFTFGIQTTLTDVVGVTSEGQVLTPRSMKIDLMIEGYPYEGYKGQNNTRLALQTIVATAQANATASASFGADIISSGNSSAQLAFSWNTNAQVGANPSASVTATGFADFTTISQLGFAAFIFFGASASASADFKQVFFSFDGVQPSYIYWDPLLSSGPIPTTTPLDSDSNAALAIGLGVGLGLAAVIAIGAIGFFYIRTKKAKQTTDGLITHDQLSGASYTSA